jgi:Uma2 family endonuclease
MSTAPKFSYMSAEEYLRTEKTSKVKREFVKGLVYAMTGANQKHNVITGNLFRALQDYLDGTPCMAFVEAFKVRILTEECFYYPDVLVACEGLHDDNDYTDQPVFIAEILSPSTAAIDRREKRSTYLRIPSLKQYAIIHQRRKRVELHERDEAGNWQEFELVSGDDLKVLGLPGSGLSIAIDLLYRNTTVPRGTLGVSEEIEDEYEFNSAEEDLLYD